MRACDAPSSCAVGPKNRQRLIQQDSTGEVTKIELPIASENLLSYHRGSR
jgi:hypothetical protein